MPLVSGYHSLYILLHWHASDVAMCEYDTYYCWVGGASLFALIYGGSAHVPVAILVVLAHEK